MVVDSQRGAPSAADPSAAGIVVVRGLEGAIGERVGAVLDAAGFRMSRDPVEGADAVVDALVADYDLMGEMGLSPVVEMARSIDIANESGAELVVLASSAMVYGALPNNPIPLTEDGVLRPPPDFAYARMLAAAEEMLEEWRCQRSGRLTTVLRMALPVSERHSSSLARALTAGLGLHRGHTDAPAQFVHLDDVAAAVLIALERRLDGVFNVAPDGWIPGDRLPALAGNRPRLRLPDRVAEVVGALRWRFQRGPIPPGLQPYIRHSWVVANDKLRAEGWRPTVSNEEAFVEGTEAPWWSMITPKRRQELALGGLVAMFAGVILMILGTVGRRRRR